MARAKREEGGAKGKALVAELRVKYVTDFLSLWQQFYRMFDEGARKQHVTDEEDAEFLRIKAHILNLVQMLYESLGSEVSFRARVIKILTEVPSMHFLPTESPVKINDLRTQWNEALIAATKLSGTLKNAVGE